LSSRPLKHQGTTSERLWVENRYDSVLFLNRAFASILPPRTRNPAMGLFLTPSEIAPGSDPGWISEGGWGVGQSTTTAPGCMPQTHGRDGVTARLRRAGFGECPTFGGSEHRRRKPPAPGVGGGGSSEDSTYFVRYCRARRRISPTSPEGLSAMTASTACMAWACL